jgi:integrase
MAKDPIKRIELKDGSVRYRFVVDGPRDRVTGKRKQITKTYDRKGEARKEYDRIRNKTAEGTYVAPSKVTVNEVIDSYLKAATRDRRANTARNYADAFRVVRERLGDRHAQTITADDIEDLIAYMRTSGRKRGGKPGTGLSGRSVNMTLGRLKASFERAVREGRLVRNVVALVDPVEHSPAKRETWSATEVQTFLRAIKGDRLAAAFRLSLYGLRRGEVLGLRWSDIDLKAEPRPTLTVAQSRVLCDYQVRIELPKSRNGLRTLPLDDELVAALKALRKRQAAEAEEAGAAYGDGEYIACDETGEPVHPEWYSDEFGRLLKAAGLRRIRLHDARHSTLSNMEKAGVPISIVSAWAGHYDPSFTYKVYVHGDNAEDLAKGGEQLAQILKIS